MKYHVRTSIGYQIIDKAVYHVIKDGLLTIFENHVVRELVPDYPSAKLVMKDVLKNRATYISRDWQDFSIEYGEDI
jgi:hypothetical protein